jgi:hypothetical protein
MRSINLAQSRRGSPTVKFHEPATARSRRTRGQPQPALFWRAATVRTGPAELACFNHGDGTPGCAGRHGHDHSGIAPPTITTSYFSAAIAVFSCCERCASEAKFRAGLNTSWEWAFSRSHHTPYSRVSPLCLPLPVGTERRLRDSVVSVRWVIPSQSIVRHAGPGGQSQPGLKSKSFQR